jgi:hypothetical protein
MPSKSVRRRAAKRLKAKLQLERERKRDDLRALVNACLSYAEGERDRDDRISEADTRYHMIDHVMKWLGWGVTDPHELRVDHNESPDIPDYVCLKDKIPCFLVEAKPLGQDIYSTKTVRQVVVYGCALAVPVVALTNGLQWATFTYISDKPMDERLLASINLRTSDFDKIERFFRSLSRENLIDGPGRRSRVREAGAPQAKKPTYKRASLDLNSVVPSLAAHLGANLVRPEGSKARNVFTTETGKVHFCVARRNPETAKAQFNLTRGHLEADHVSFVVENESVSFLVARQELAVYLGAASADGHESAPASWSTHLRDVDGKPTLWTNFADPGRPKELDLSGCAYQIREFERAG